MRAGLGFAGYIMSERNEKATSSPTPPVLELERFGVAFGERVVLYELSASLSDRALGVLVGPAGSGKSTLVRTLCGLNDTHPFLTTWGAVRLAGQAWGWDGRRHSAGLARPRLVVQHARFFLDTVAENLIGGLPDRARYDRATQLRLVSDALDANGLADLVPALEREAVSLSLADQRCLSIVRAALANPPLLLADEPTAGLDDTGAEAVVRLLKLQAAQRGVLFVTHHQRLARLAGGTTFLLAHGRIQEVAPTERFFTRPASELGRQFVASGSCPTTLPGSSRPAQSPAEASARTVDEENAASASATPPRPRPERRPRGFCWITPGRLGGLPRPGVIDDVHEDLRGLQALGVTLLITLEEQLTVDSDALLALGIESVHFPIPDMGVPALSDALRLGARVQGWMESGRRVAYHCLAGHGRTGTMLACQLIVDGQDARSALDQVRAVNPRYVQSEAQVAFLKRLELARKPTRLIDCDSTLLDERSRKTTTKEAKCH